jgi:hypothetical protein
MSLGLRLVGYGLAATADLNFTYVSERVQILHRKKILTSWGVRGMCGGGLDHDCVGSVGCGGCVGVSGVGCFRRHLFRGA